LDDETTISTPMTTKTDDLDNDLEIDESDELDADY